MKALVIPVEGPLEYIELGNNAHSDLDALQAAVGGYIEALPLPDFITGATAYVNEEGKFTLEPNMRATDFMVPGVGSHFGDYIAGPLVLCGFNPLTGEHDELPAGVIGRALLIEAEAS